MTNEAVFEALRILVNGSHFNHGSKPANLIVIIADKVSSKTKLFSLDPLCISVEQHQDQQSVFGNENIKVWRERWIKCVSLTADAWELAALELWGDASKSLGGIPTLTPIY